MIQCIVPVFSALAFAASAMAGAVTEGWDNYDPTRRERVPARLYWNAQFDKGAAAFVVEKCGGAEGDVVFADGAMTVRKTNERGWIVVKATGRFSVKAGTTIRSFADAEVCGADQFHSVAVLRISGNRERLHASWGLDAVQVFMCGGPKMGFLSNTAPGRPERRFASVKVTEDYGTNVAPVLVVAGAPSTSVWRRWCVEDHNSAHGQWMNHVGRHRGDSTRISHGVSKEEYLELLAGDMEHTAKVVAGPGETRIVVDGEVDTPVIYKPTQDWPKWYRTTGSFLLKEGIRLQTAVLDCAMCWGTNGLDVTQTIEGAIDQMRRAPEALFIVSLKLDVPPEYMAMHPDERWIDSTGRAVYGNKYHCHVWRNGKPPEGCWPWPSIFSPVWRKDIDTFLAEVVRGLRRTGLSRRIVGFHVCGYHDGQFAPWTPDYSPHAARAFREWMNVRGTPLAQGTALPKSSDGEVFFPDTPEGRLKRDFQTFQHIAPFRVQEGFARQVKAALGKEVVALHWCNDVLGGNRAGAYYLDEFMKSDVMDGLVAQPSYTQRLPGLALGEQIPSASFTWHGKLYIDEFDIRTYGLIAGNFNELSAYGLGLLRDFAEWQSGHHRIAGLCMARRQGWWYFELSGGFFEPSEIAADIGTVTHIRREQARLKERSEWEPSAALLIDEKGLLARNLMGNVGNDSRKLLNTFRLAAAGVPYDVWLAADVMDKPELIASRKILLLAGFHDLDASRTRFIKRLLDGGRTVVLFAGTGAAGGADRLGIKPVFRKPPVDHEVESLTGDGSDFRSGFYADWLRWALGIIGWPMEVEGLWRPACFSFDEMPGFRPLARYVKDGKVAAIECMVNGGRLVALGEANGLTPAFFNRLARDVGAYVPVAGGGRLQVDMNGDFVSIHALDNGHFDFRLPFPCKVVNLKTGKPVATSDGILPLDLVAGETRWYSLKRD